MVSGKVWMDLKCNSWFHGFVVMEKVNEALWVDEHRRPVHLLKGIFLYPLGFSHFSVLFSSSLIGRFETSHSALELRASSFGFG